MVSERLHGLPIGTREVFQRVLSIIAMDAMVVDAMALDALAEQATDAMPMGRRRCQVRSLANVDEALARMTRGGFSSAVPANDRGHCDHCCGQGPPLARRLCSYGCRGYPVVICNWVYYSLGARFTRLPSVSREYHPIEQVKLSATRLLSESLVTSEHHL